MCDLLFAQRVNKLFQSSINTSKPLQRKSFFAPVDKALEQEQFELNPMFNAEFFRKTSLVIPSRTGVCFVNSPPVLKDAKWKDLTQLLEMSRSLSTHWEVQSIENW